METSKQKPIVLIPQKGERALIVGQTGSGKTAFACFVLARMEQSPILIYDTKTEPKFAALKNAVIVTNMDEAMREYETGESDYIVIRPPIDVVNDAKELDKMLIQHFHYFENCPAYIDEAYSFHRHGQALPGLIGLLTRGRSKGITTVLSTQRPAWLSMFALTEVQKFYIFKLKHRDDYKRMDNVIDGFAELEKLPRHYFYFSDDEHEKPVKFPPVKLDANIEQGYTLSDGGEDGSVQSSNNRRVVWIS